MERNLRLALAACVVFGTAVLASPAHGTSLEQVRELARQARFPEARMELERLPAGMREAFGARLLDGVLRVREGSLDEATEVFEEIVHTHPNRPEARINLALLDAARLGLPDVRERLVDAATQGRARALAWWLLRDLSSRLALHAYLHADTIDSGGSMGRVQPGPPALALAPLRMPFEPDAPSAGRPTPPPNELPSVGAPGGPPTLPSGESNAPYPSLATVEPLETAAPDDSATGTGPAETGGAASIRAAIRPDDPLAARDPLDEAGEPGSPGGGSGAANPGTDGPEAVDLATRGGVTPPADAADSGDAFGEVPQLGGGARSERDGARPDAAAAKATGAYLEAVADGLTTVVAGSDDRRRPAATSNARVPGRNADSHASSWNALLKAIAVAAGTMVVLAAAGGIVLLLRRRPPRDRAFRRRLQRAAVLLGGVAATEEAETEASIFRPTEKRSPLSGLWERVEARYPLLRIGQALPVAMGAGVAGAGGCWFSLWFLQVPVAWWSTPVAVIAGVGAMWYSISWLQSRQEAEFIRQFPEVVDQIVRLAGAGVPPLEAVSVVAEDARDPIAPVLASIRDGLLAGLDADSILRSAAERVRLGEFTLFAAVIRLQRRAGGGISAAFSNLADTLRERRQTALKAHASTAQSRLTLLVLVMMPVVVLIAQKFIAPQSIEMLFGTERGVTLLRWGVGLIVGGILVAKNIAARAVR